MKIQNMFEKDIDRDINGVVKVSQDDEQSLKQELSEYIITKELKKHFYTFFDNYLEAISRPTDKIGVWISGFFGSGKSHFLKMLSYLLTNKEVAGKHAVEYFADKFDDPMMYANIQKCASIPTESILFDILKQSPINKDQTAILRVFAKMFYRHLGYYGDDLKVAKLERFIDKKGKTDEFRKTFEETNGAAWVDSRDTFAFFEDDIVEVLQKTLGMSEESARNWFNGEETNELSVEQLVSDIADYVNSKPGDFRLLFMVDEMGFYIGDDSGLMGNLQALVEEIGTKCRGKVWVMVTSQEAIDSVVKITGNDFSKIQGRFNTRLSLSSSSVDEVIKERVLRKTPDADKLLRMEYEKESSGLKSLFAFDNPIKDIKGFSDAAEFSSTFPFVPYQFKVIQNVLAEIRKHGNSGKHLSGGERSMLSGFQEAAQQIEDRDENSLVPFWRFYDTVHTFLESAIRRVIDRCQNAADSKYGLEQSDVSVLKLLYLVRYVNDVRANIENISILMIDDIHADKITLRAEVSASLERLMAQNYISRSGDTYSFLTDEEQDIATDIKNTQVDSSQVVQSISQTIFGEIYPSKKFKYGRYDFSYDQFADETQSGASTGGMRLRIVTVAGDLYNRGDRQLILSSQVNKEAIVVLSVDTQYYNELERAMKIRKFSKQRNVSQLPASVQRIIRERNDEAHSLENHARAQIEKAIAEGKFYVHGEVLEMRSGTAKSKLDEAMKYLVESVYSKLNMVNQFADSDADILTILNCAPEQAGISGSGANNEDALNEISQWLELRANNNIRVTMGDVQRKYQGIPFGWREIDIAAMIAKLVVRQRIQITYGGAVIGKDERRLVDLLRKKTEIDKVTVARRIAPSEELMRKSIDFLRDYLGAMDIPNDEDGLRQFVIYTFEKKRDHYKELLSFYEKGNYPEKSTVTTALGLIDDILGQMKDNVALFTRMVKSQDELLDSKDDMENVEMFFKGQRPVFDEAVKCLDRIKKEHDYFMSDAGTQEIIRTIGEIIAMPKPYKRIGELPELVQKLKREYSKLLDLKRGEVAEIIRQCMEDVHQLSSEARGAGELLKRADDYFVEKRDAAKESQSLTELDAMIPQTLNHKNQICQQLEALAVPEAPAVTDPIITPSQPVRIPKITTLRRYDLCPAKRLQTKEDIDKYVESIREKLYSKLDGCDGVQIN